MRKRIISAVLVIGLVIGYIPFQSFAAEIGDNGKVINGDYVIAVNTNADPNNKQSSGTLVFDSMGGRGTTSLENELNQEAEDIDFIVDGSDTKVENKNLFSRLLGVGDIYSIGDEKKFYQGRTYVCIGVYDKSYIWMEKSMKNDYDAAGKTNDAAEDMRSTYESKPYEVLMELSDNKFPYNDGSGKLSILLEQTSNGSSGFYAGESGITAIHINIPKAAEYTKGRLSSTNGLLVHEGQHAIFRNLTCGGDAQLASKYRWLDEGLAVASMDYTWGGSDPSGWFDYIKGNPQIRNGSALVYSSYRNSSAQDYAMPDLFVRYLANQKSKGYKPIEFFQGIYRVTATGKDTKTFMNDVFKAAGLKDENGNVLTFDKSLVQFYAAIIAQDKDGVYGFYGDPVVLNKLNDYPIYMGESGKPVMLSGTAAIVLKTENGEFKVPSDGGKDIRYIAVNRSDTVSKPSKGSGTAVDPYKIEKASDLFYIASNQSCHFILTSDLDLTGSTYISAGWFGGSLDGRGYTIKGLKQPLIERNKGTIKNLNIEADFKSDYQAYTGALANINEGKILNSSVKGNFDIQMTGTGYGVVQTFGGLVGRNEVSGVIRESFVDANINVKFGFSHGSAGALVGKNSGAIENSYARGYLNVIQDNRGDYKFYVGGITGELTRDMGLGATLKNCYSTTQISTRAVSDSNKQAIGRLYGQDQNISVNSVSQSYALDGMDAVGKTTSGVDWEIYSKTSDQLKKVATYVNWSFNSIWKIQEGKDYPVFIEASDIKTISVSVPQIEKERYVGEELLLYSAKLIVNGTAVPLTNDMINGFDSSTEGVKTVTGNYKNKVFQFDVTVKAPKSVDKLEISKAGKTSYVQGEEYSSAGVVLMATLDGTPYHYIKSGFKSDLDGILLDNQNRVTFSYYDGKVSQEITVKKDEPKALTVVNPMNKVDYYSEDKLDFSGMGIQITYASGKKSSVLRFDELKGNGIRLVLDNNGKFTTVDSDTVLTEKENGTNIYACFGDKNPNEFGSIFARLAQITVKPKLHLDSQIFLLGQNVTRFDLFTDMVVGGEGNYKFEIVEGKLPKGIREVKNMPGSTRILFEGTPTEVGETRVVYKISDSVGNTTLTDIIFVVNPPSSVAEVESFSITNARESYPAVIKGTTIELIVPADIQLSSYWASVKLSDGSNYYPDPNMPPIVKEGIQTLAIIAQDKKTIKEYTVLIKRATQNMQPLDKPKNLVWDSNTNTLSWDSVNNAESYIVNIAPEGEVSYMVSTSENKLNLKDVVQKSGNIGLSVFTIGDNINTYTGKSSEITVSYVAPPQIKYISVNPKKIEAFKGHNTQFKVTISANSNADKSVTWSIEGASSASTSIDSKGVLTIGDDETSSEVQVIATSNHDPSKKARAVATIKELPKLNTPSGLIWKGQVATWNAVDNANGYSVELYKDGIKVGESQETNNTQFDFTNKMKEAGIYKFRVIALGDGKTIANSDEAESLEYNYIVDINHDGKVDMLDLAIVSEKYNLKSTDVGYIKDCDLNNDGIIDIYDIVMVANKIK